ncbi:hypothetical protein OSB04_un000171 [Centaurea solstitialis]|uniref:Reverse transcriptase domain-containing protein n=1 Tax=Centaurea solstitialis TaxID=347529 RepID=A0AA38SP25_9ASTR|nr:hypothetical protein OSB04_un000171 [Centaurea solstitialis]
MEDSLEDAMDLIVSGSSHLGAADTTMVVEDVDSDSDDQGVSVPDKSDNPGIEDDQNNSCKSVFDRLEVDSRLKIPTDSKGNKSFADAVGSTGDEQKALEFFPLADKSQCRVKIPVELAKRASLSFITTACGYFLGPRLQFSVVKRFAASQWVMRNGVPFFLLPWDPTRGISKPQHTSCPLWVKIHNIPLVAFNNEGISRIASALGILIRMDACTSSMCDKSWGRPGFAKVLIDVWAVGELKRELQIVIPSLSGGNDTTVILKVEYLWEPIQCTHCMVFGHRTSSCPKAAIIKKDKGKALLVDEEGFQKVVTKKWVPKHVAAGDGASHSGLLLSRLCLRMWVGQSLRPVLCLLEISARVASASPVGGGMDSVSTPAPVPSYVRFTRGSSDQSFKHSVLQNSKFIANRGAFIPDKPADPGVKEVPKSNAFDVLSDLGDVELAACWNTRGLNAPVKQLEVRDLVSRFGISFIALVETHVQQAGLQGILATVFGSWKWFSNSQVSPFGTRIVFAWDERIADVMRALVWSCKAKVLMGDKPWLVMGDFNSILFPHDGFGGCSRRNQSMEDFYHCVEDVELFDIRYSGIQFTWIQKPKGDEGLLRKLDRIMVNTHFLQCFADSSAQFLPHGVSDHSCGILDIPSVSRKVTRGFRVDNLLTENPAFLDIVSREWLVPLYGSFMHRFVCHLKRLKKPMRQLRSQIGDVTVRTNKLRVELEAAQLACDRDPSNPIIREDLAHLILAFEHARADELSFFRQRAKILWLHEGDKNSKFFHQVVKEKRNLSSIRSIVDSSGTYVQDDGVAQVFVNHFQGFLGMVDSIVDPHVPGEYFTSFLSISESLHMIRPITDEEIRWAVFHIGNDKAPGPDGYTFKFFKSAWDIVGNDLQVAVDNFFYSGRMLKEINHTLLCFIPKVPNASRVTDFRPISCCNVLYKVISKVIAERMKPYLSQLIGPEQSAFIPGRRISDNILMAHELVAGYQRDSGRPRCAFKIDLRKAYDTVDWRFLLRMLRGLGFHPVFCKWIDQMLQTSSFSIVLNGETTGYFEGARGLRQGDPISPYLFTIVMECFSIILKRCILEAGNFSFHQGCDDLAITHLCFADDLFVFTGGDLQSVEVLKRALDMFRRMSGLEPNIAKSDAFFCNVIPEDQAVILNCLPFKPGVFPIRYLGVPLSSVCLRVADFAPLVNKVNLRVHNWKTKFLSFGGRKQLVTSVLQSMQLYWMSIYVLPSSVVHELEACFRDFLWAQGDSSKGKCKVSWVAVCRPISNGGLGFKRIGAWNRAFIAKHIWDLLTRRNSLWVNWIRRYYIRQQSFWLLKPKPSWSWVFRRILDTRLLVRRFFVYQLGSGETVNAWADTWLEAGPLSDIISFRRFTSEGYHLHTSVRDLIVDCDGSWPILWVNWNPDAFDQHMPFLTHGAPDVVRWKDVHGNAIDFSIREASRSIFGIDPLVPWTKFVWFKGHVPKFSFCMWTACCWRLPTQDRIGTWEVWRRSKVEFGLFGFPELWTNIMELLCDNRGPSKMVHRLALSGTIYHIWRERNRRLFRDVKQLPIVTYRQLGFVYGFLLSRAAQISLSLVGCGETSLYVPSSFCGVAALFFSPRHFVSGDLRRFDLKGVLTMGFEEIFGDTIPQTAVSRKSVFDRLTADARLQHDVKLKPNLDFAAVVGKGSSDKLSFFPLENKATSLVRIPVELAKEVMKTHHTTLMGYFLGPRLNFPVVQGYVKTVWGKYGFVDAMMNNNGVYFFKFNDAGGCQQVIDSGPLMIRGVPMFVSLWDPLKGLSKPIHTTCPLWVKLLGIADKNNYAQRNKTEFPNQKIHPKQV